MTVYSGVDLHVQTQTVCWCDPADGEVHQRTLDHQRDDLRKFYAQFAPGTIVGVESSGYALWFHQLVEEAGHKVLVGDAFAIRRFARRRQKSDRRDAELLLDLLLHGEFPVVHMPCPASREYRRRTRPMQVFPNPESAERIYYGVTDYLNQNWEERPR